MRISDWSSDVCSSDLQLLDALDRIAFAVEQRVDPAHQRDIAGAVIAPLAGALERPQLGKARFPIAQDVLRQPRLARHLPDRAERGVGLVGSAGHFCRYPAATMRSRITWLARKELGRASCRESVCQSV